MASPAPARAVSQPAGERDVMDAEEMPRELDGAVYRVMPLGRELRQGRMGGCVFRAEHPAIAGMLSRWERMPA